MHAHNQKHHILWEGGGQFMKMVVLTNIVTTTGIEKQNAHKLRCYKVDSLTSKCVCTHR